MIPSLELVCIRFMAHHIANEVPPSVNYSGSIAFEVRTSPSTGPFIRFNFKNGTDDPSYNTYGIMGSPSGDVPTQTFIDNLAPLGVGTLPAWCKTCGNTNSRGCQFLQGNVNTGTEGLRWGGTVSPMGAGFLGAGLTVVVIGILATVGIILGLLRVGKRKPLGRAPSDASSGESALVVCAYERCILVRAIDPPLLYRMHQKNRYKSDDCRQRQQRPPWFVILM